MAKLTRLTGIAPRLDTSSAKIPPKTADAYYHTPAWRDLREQCLVRDGFVCQLALPGCTHTATIADHIISRNNGGADDLSNLRAVCRPCDNRLKENHLGERRGRA